MSSEARPTLRRISLAARLGALTSAVLVLMSMTLFLGFAAKDRARLVAAKSTAAAMVTQLLANELTAAIDFNDIDAVTTSLNFLHSNPEIIAASVWAPSPSPEAIVSWASPGAPAVTRPPPGQLDGSTASPDWLITTRTIGTQTSGGRASVTVIFTLGPENEAFRSNRLRLAMMTAGLSACAALLLAILVRRYVAGPIGRLASAATALADGDLSARVVVSSDDEIGELARAFNVMSEAVGFREERLHNELKLAQRIQSSILPRTLVVPGLELGALMVPTTEVGGDYYDVLPIDGGCWIGMGDVAGHGLDAGLIMLMTQSIVASLVAADPSAAPSKIVCVLNEVLFDNIRNRLGRHDHATLTLLRYHRSGEVIFAGAHEEIVVYREGEQRCELLPTPGTWVGGRRDIRQGTVDSSLKLAVGDVMLLYTDGLIEIRNDKGEQFGVERLASELERVHDEPVARIQEHLLLAAGAWGAADDDVTVMVARYIGDEGAALPSADSTS